MRVEEITEAALGLSSDARALLADRLVESLDPAEPGEIHAAWAHEANRRLRELRTGQVEAIEGEAAVRKLKEKHRR